ncbi:MAG: Bro-N domain-containing protein [Alphaproteobacteria bacterium]|nr:Bro-N domain-containing protein [Alphaproteobacteria bacterium]
MNTETAVKLFENHKIRTQWDENQEKWYFSIVDILAILTQSPNPRKYWSVLKARLKSEGSELTTNCSQLKMKAADGKMYLTDVADVEQVFRLIQSIPSPKAEPFKLWLAQIGRERIDEIEDPEITINRALETYLKKGYSESWINQRLKSIEIRKGLTDEWDRGGIQKGKEYAILTDELTRSWSGMRTREYKKLKGLKKENLRDNMTNMELVLNMLAEVSATEISKTQNPKGLEENKKVARAGGDVARKARKELETKTGKKVITSLNAKHLQGQIEEKMDE